MLSYPGLEDWNIIPATLEVPVEEGRLWGWGWHYGPWGLGAVFGVGMAWFVIRRKAHPGRTRVFVRPTASLTPRAAIGNGLDPPTAM